MLFPWQGSSKADGNASPKNKRDEPAPELTPLDKMLQNAGAIRQDGSDKFFGLENVRLTSNTSPTDRTNVIVPRSLETHGNARHPWACRKAMLMMEQLL